MRVLIFGGTTEGRRLARALSAMGHQVWVSVATPLGAEELAGLEDVSVLVGRRSGGEMDALLSRGFHRCVDATHPYAVQATREIGAACARAGVPLRRLLRPEGGEEGLRVDSPEEAARLLAGREGNILLATGAKELPAFAALEPARLFPRVLPSEESVAPPTESTPSTPFFLTISGIICSIGAAMIISVSPCFTTLTSAILPPLTST